jgi:hypothetical protein
MPSQKLTEEQKHALAVNLREINEQAANIHEHIEFIRENARLPPFASDVATSAELLELIRASEAEFVLFAEHHVPIYLGQCLIDEFEGHWSVEQNPRILMFGRPYVDGFGNIGYENIYLPMLKLQSEEDAKRFDRFRASCRRACDLRAKFTSAFSRLAGTSILRSELEQQCADLNVLPKGFEVERVWRERVATYAKMLKIKVQRG